MTSSNGLKSIVSLLGSVPRTSLNLNFSPEKEGRLSAKSLMCDMLYSTSPLEYETTLSVGGGQYDYKSISAFQSSEVSVGCKDCIGEDWFSLQIQHKLSHHLDTKVSEEIVIW